MLLKLILISIILVAFVILAMGLRLLFDKKAEFTYHSCSSGESCGCGASAGDDCETAVGNDNPDEIH